MKKVLITGGRGGMAISIKDKLKRNYEVLNPDKNTLDVTKENVIKKYIEKNKPDILINCAGYIVPNNIKNTSLLEWKKHFAVNVTGAFLCSKYSLKNGCERIINIGSTSGFEGRKNWGAYCSSKSALVSLTETLIKEDIKCISLNPSRTKTKMRSRLFPNESQDKLMSPERIAEFVSEILDCKYDYCAHIILKKD
jgi:NAD(P)-dependent dehydrogenase (short-subunit alcohol dehydrogenase family)